RGVCTRGDQKDGPAGPTRKKSFPRNSRFLSSVQCATIRIALPPAPEPAAAACALHRARSAGGTAAREATMSLYPVWEVAHFSRRVPPYCGADGSPGVTSCIASSCVEGVPPDAEYAHCTPARAGGPRAIPPTGAKVCGLGLRVAAT